MNRTRNERLADLALLLYLVGLIRSNSGLYLGITKLDKLAFLSEKEMLDRKIRGFNYEFFKWHHGPLSTDIYVDVETLRRAGFVSSKEDIALTTRGNKALGKLSKLFKDHESATTLIDSITRRLSGLNTQELVDQVYGTVVTYPMGSKRIRDMPMGQVILNPRERSATFSLDDSWAETLEILLDWEGYESLKQAAAEAERGKVKPLG